MGAAVIVLMVGMAGVSRRMEKAVGIMRAQNQVGLALDVAGGGREEAIEHGHQVASQEQCAQHRPDDHDRQRFLGL